MFHIREVSPEDLPEVYKQSTELYHHHIGLRFESLLGEADFTELFKRGYVRGLLLTYSQTNPSHNHMHSLTENARPIGSIIYHPTVSAFHGNGIFVDQLFIVPEFRRRGLGYMMMTKLCQMCIENHENHIRLSFQKALSLDKFYTRLGFKNYTALPPRLHLFEAFGKSELDRVLNRGKEFQESLSANVKKRSFVKMVLPFKASLTGEYPQWTSLNYHSPHRHDYPMNTLCPPESQNIIIADRLLGNLAEQTDKTELSNLPSICTFVEKITVCSWTGPIVTFCDFMGNITLLQPDVLYNRLYHWSQVHPDLCGAIWEVPCENENGDSPNSDSLRNSLNLLGVFDGTERDGWNICYLDAAGIRHLASEVT